MQATTTDYRLTGANTALAIEKGLAEAEWYSCPVPKSEMRRLLARCNGPALRDTALWFGLLVGFGLWAYAWWGSAWAILPFMLYGVIYGTTSDSRWHEASHGTPFKTDWLNNALYEIASFMVMREATVWRWSHTRHHSDTLVVGRDPEIAVPRPTPLHRFILNFTGLPAAKAYFTTVFLHCTGRLTPAEQTFVPASEHRKVVWRARLYATIYVAVIGLALYHHSLLPLLFIGLPNLYGAWLMPVYGFTQHAGLAENVLDHRLNCRTVTMNVINRYLYWNMNYHVEHHMFPLVPYHALPRLHELVKADMPVPYPGLRAAWSELLPAVLRQRKDISYYVKRPLPPPAPRAAPVIITPVSPAAPDGWQELCGADRLACEDVVRIDQGKRTYALARDAAGAWFVTDGICTHGNAHLADGLVKGSIIECPKHNGRFSLADGSPARAPVCCGLCTYPVENRSGTLFFNPARAGGAGVRQPASLRYRVVSNQPVSTFIKELVLESVDPAQQLNFTPGDYLQFDIPPYERIAFREFGIPPPYADTWATQGLFDLVSSHPDSGPRRNNYSLACNPDVEKILRFTIRIATPPSGSPHPPGVGSSYMFTLKPGDTVTAVGPFGDFHIKPTQREMIYVGGGSGMAPLRAHLSHLLDTAKTARKISFWYGARSRQDLFYQDYFETLAASHPNFSYHTALSAPRPSDQWTGHCGYIHEVLLARYLKAHATPSAVEYYLCGPPMMIQSCITMLRELGVPLLQIAYDEF